MAIDMPTSEYTCIKATNENTTAIKAKSSTNRVRARRTFKPNAIAWRANVLENIQDPPSKAILDSELFLFT
jgi:hypothetical protein